MFDVSHPHLRPIVFPGFLSLLVSSVPMHPPLLAAGGIGDARENDVE
jgi:hypothetical protein